jgi:hypothetical protein
MSPTRIASEARKRGLSLIALCDHNSALNCPAFAEACLEVSIEAVFGIEITTREEVHVLALFPEPQNALAFGEFLYPLLLSGKYDPVRYGDQVYVNTAEEILGNVEKHLIGAVDLTMDDLERITHERGGLFIPAHIDRTTYSVISQLGFLPDGTYDGLEVTSMPCRVDTHGLPLVTGSDAHYVEDIGSRYTAFSAETCSFSGLVSALRAGKTVPCCTRPTPGV